MFLGIPQIEHLAGLARGQHGGYQAGNQIADIAKASRLHSRAVNRYRFALNRLSDKVRHHATVINARMRAVGVEYANYSGVKSEGSNVLRCNRLAESLPLVVTTARTIRIDVSPIRLGLGVFEGVAVNLRGGCIHECRAPNSG